MPAEQSRSPIQQPLIYTELEEPRRQLVMREYVFDPLGSAALESARFGHVLELDFIARGKVSINGQADQSMTANFTWCLQRSCSDALLIPGGWLPVGLPGTYHYLHLLDHCTVDNLLGQSRKQGTGEHLFELLAEQPTKISPLLYVLEGNQGRIPDLQELLSNYADVASRLANALPRAIIPPLSERLVLGLTGLGGELFAQSERQISLILEVAPHLLAPVPPREREAVRGLVNAAAQRCGIPRTHLFMMAIELAVSANKKNHPARGVLKLNKNKYSEKLAHNAVSDLRAISMLTTMLAAFPSESVALCTSDKDLIRLWIGLGCHGFRRGPGNTATADYSISPELLANP